MESKLSQNPFESSKAQTNERPSAPSRGMRRAFFVFLGCLLVTNLYHGAFAFLVTYHKQHDGCTHQTVDQCLDATIGFHPTNSMYAMSLFAICSFCAASIWWIDRLGEFTRFYLVFGALVSFIGINAGIVAIAHSVALFMAR